MATPVRSLSCLLFLMVCAFSGAKLVHAQDVPSDSELDAAFHVIMEHSPELESTDLSHLTNLNKRSELTRAIKLVMDCFRNISAHTDLASARYRRYDGLGNNLKNPMWGCSLHKQRRLLDNSYDDGSSIPRYRSKTGQVLPSARDVSMKCFLPDQENMDYWDRCISQMFMQFGQYLDHDVIFTELEQATNCCNDINDNGTHPDMFSGGVCFPIKISPNDRYFKTDCMSVRRSMGADVRSVREQINGVSSYIDASQVYGPSDILAEEIRSKVDGLLKVTSYNGLPELGHLKCFKSNMHACPHAGDPRANVFPGLTAIHTLFHREHNRIARKLKEVNDHWDDERLYQEARKIVIAINQKIVFEEYLPKVFGHDMMKVMGLSKPYVYDENLDASISNVFGAAAFRFGHSQINGELMINKTESYKLSETYFHPAICSDRGEKVIKDLIVNQARLRAQKSDHFFTIEVLDLLFKDVDHKDESFDLPGLAVQRGRDHGLPAYLEYVSLMVRELTKKSGIDPATISGLKLPTCALSGVYERMADIDLFVGAMYETPVTGGLVGPTFAYLLGEQFYRLKFGDRFWYETPDQNIGFTPAQLASIQKNACLANVICSNTVASEIQPRPMETRRFQNNKPCSEYEELDLTLWKEEKPQA